MIDSLTIDEATYFDHLASIEEAHWWSASVWRLAAHWLDRALRGRRGLRALDVGCGSGGTLRRLANRPEIAEVIGLDPVPAALGHARRPGAILVRGDALNLPFPGAGFDLVTCFDVFQHLPDGGDRRAALEIRRVLRPGGLALIRANGRGLWPDPAVVPGPYRLGRLVDALESSGLRVRRATYVNALPAVAAELRGRFGPRHGRSDAGHPAGRGLTIRLPTPRINRLMAAVGASEAYLAGRLGIRLPVGHSTMALAIRDHSGGHAQAPGLASISE